MDLSSKPERHHKNVCKGIDEEFSISVGKPLILSLFSLSNHLALSFFCLFLLCQTISSVTHATRWILFFDKDVFTEDCYMKGESWISKTFRMLHQLKWFSTPMSLITLFRDNRSVVNFRHDEKKSDIKFKILLAWIIFHSSVGEYFILNISNFQIKNYLKKSESI